MAEDLCKILVRHRCSTQAPGGQGMSPGAGRCLCAQDVTGYHLYVYIAYDFLDKM